MHIHSSQWRFIIAQRSRRAISIIKLQEAIGIHTLKARNAREEVEGRTSSRTVESIRAEIWAAENICRLMCFPMTYFTN